MHPPFELFAADPTAKMVQLHDVFPSIQAAREALSKCQRRD